MPRDPLDAVLRIRRVAVDDAKRGLAACLRRESLARSAAQAAESLIIEEGEVAADLASGDAVVEAYGRWLPTGRAQAAAARASHDQAQAAVGVSRAALNAANAAAEAAASLLARRAAERAAHLARKEQEEMDEVASRRRGPTSV